MSHYKLDEMIARWGREELTAEQMIGQMLLVLRTQEQHMREYERRLPLRVPERVVDVLEQEQELTETAQVTVVS